MFKPILTADIENLSLLCFLQLLKFEKAKWAQNFRFVTQTAKKGHNGAISSPSGRFVLICVFTNGICGFCKYDLWILDFVLDFPGWGGNSITLCHKHHGAISSTMESPSAEGYPVSSSTRVISEKSF